MISVFCKCVISKLMYSSVIVLFQKQCPEIRFFCICDLSLNKTKEQTNKQKTNKEKKRKQQGKHKH